MQTVLIECGLLFGSIPGKICGSFSEYCDDISRPVRTGWVRNILNMAYTLTEPLDSIVNFFGYYPCIIFINHRSFFSNCSLIFYNCSLIFYNCSLMLSDD